jgi:uncharacterized glyoxalase superfamily protein PhnB
MKSATVPILRYEDARKAIDWLRNVFGFKVFLEVPGKSGAIEHARLTLGDNMIMVASLGRDGDFENSFLSPSKIGGVTQCTSLYVEDPEIIYKMAVENGAQIIDEIEDFQFGGKTFSCKDIESHIWVITSHNPWNKLW